jgi:NAD(P)-dependent dehydrogenase (short-subunit alcohol dehydrogenase family)
MKIEGKTFFVTGGASGLGEGVVRLFTSKGANCVIADLNSKKGQALAADIGSQAFFAKCNVTDEKSVQAAMEAGVEKFGTLHGCVNCAGTGPPRRILSKSGRVHPLNHFSKVIEINLIGTFNVLRLAAKVASGNTPDDKGERGVIINVASVAAIDGQIGQAAYSASKAGVCGMTLPIARDLGKWGIRICTICPGLFETPMTKPLPKPLRASLESQVQFPKRLGYPEEFAQLCSQIVENTYLNGEVIRLDGGIRMGPK